MEGGWGSFTEDFERKVRVCFCQGMCKRRLWEWESLHRGPIGEPVGCSFTRDFDRQMEGSGNKVCLSLSLSLPEICEGNLESLSLSLCPRSVRGTWREGSLTGEGSSFPRDLERRLRFFCQEDF
jgi:hypothetical protein